LASLIASSVIVDKASFLSNLFENLLTNNQKLHLNQEDMKNQSKTPS